MTFNDQSSWDDKMGKVLKKNFKMQSRRSFLEKITRITIGLAGVNLVSQMPAFSAAPEPLAAKLSSWTWCGLHGYLCGTGNCNGGSVGSGATRAWNACCYDASNNCWKCCTYTDRCSSTRHAAQGCSGTSPSGPKWCGSHGGHYICTEISCSGQGYASQSQCQCNTSPSC